MSEELAHKAVRGAAWTILASIGSRAIGLVGTLVLTQFLPPEIQGEVSIAFILVLSANTIAQQTGFGQYVVAKPREGRAAVFHATVYNLGFGVVAAGLILLLGRPLAPLFKAEAIVGYLPGLVLAGFLERVGIVPQRVLLKEMRFRLVAGARTLGELSFTGSAVGLAAAGWGGDAMVWANIIRSALVTLVFCLAADRREWLEPCRLTRARTRDLMRFALPMSVGAVAHMAARWWDNLLFGVLYNTQTVGLYNMAYNLADVPATTVGENIGDVLLPSYAHLDLEQRKSALVRSTALLALLMFPLAVGLGAVAHTAVLAFHFKGAWLGVAPMLSILSALSVARPIGWTINSYLQARDQTRSVMILEVAKVVFLLATILVLGRIGPLWACGAVGVAFGAHSLLSLVVVQKLDRIPVGRMLAGLVGPLLACAPMVGAILGTRWGLHQVGFRWALPLLVVELAVGAGAYAAAAFVFAPATAREFLRLVSKAILKRRGGGAGGAGEGGGSAGGEGGAAVA